MFYLCPPFPILPLEFRARFLKILTLARVGSREEPCLFSSSCFPYPTFVRRGRGEGRQTVESPGCTQAFILGGGAHSTGVWLPCCLMETETLAPSPPTLTADGAEAQLHS